jgi:RES domain-containing protein
MEVFRLVRGKFAEPLSGKGAAIRGARWNSIGVELIYTALNRSLAMAEVAVHFSLATLPDDYTMMTINVPDDVSIKTLSKIDLPKDWNLFPHPSSTQKIGDQFVLENEYCVLKIPSVVTQGDYNVLINPNHPDYKRLSIVEIVQFPFDKRIFKG